MKFKRKKASLPQLGLLTVAAMLPVEWVKRLLDVNVRKLLDKDLAWADVAFISGMIAQRDSAHELITRCHAAGKTIVAGGLLFGVEHEQFPGVEHFVLNEAEVTLPEFLRDFAGGCARRVQYSAEFPDIRQTPAPLWELADLRRYASMMRVVLARLPATEDLRHMELALSSGVRAREHPPRCLRSRTLSLLGVAAPDVLPPSVSRALGRHALHLRPPLPQNLPDAGVVTWTQTSIQTRQSA